MKHIIVKCSKKERSRLIRDATKEYDAVFSGALMSEYLNIWNLHNINRGYQTWIKASMLSIIYAEGKKVDSIREQNHHFQI